MNAERIKRYKEQFALARAKMRRANEDYLVALESLRDAEGVVKDAKQELMNAINSFGTIADIFIAEK